MNRKTYDALTGFFGRAFLICVAFQIFALGMYLAAGDWAYRVHSQIFSYLEPRDFHLFVYGFLGVMKTLGFMLLFSPWLALKMMSGHVVETN